MENRNAPVQVSSSPQAAQGNHAPLPTFTGLAQSISCQTMGKLFDLQGRIASDEYRREITALRLMAGAATALLIAGGAFVARLLGPFTVLTAAVAAAFLILLILFAKSSFALSVRRMHDLGASGWWIALEYSSGLGACTLLFAGVSLHLGVSVLAGFALAAVSAAISLVGFSVRGKASANRYGDAPSAAVEPDLPIAAPPRRDLDAELRAAREDLERVKAKLTTSPRTLR
jgi:uncharacterized membrane protein YhaH (DUF805 family)